MRITYKDEAAKTAVIFLNGMDVTPQVTQADSGEGWVDMVLLDEAGLVKMDGERPFIVRVYGRVIIGDNRRRHQDRVTGVLFHSALAWAHWLAMPKMHKN